MSVRRFIIIVLSALALPAFAQSPRFTYPPAKTVDVVDDYHGTKVADPYRWMEEEGTPDLVKWIDSENVLTENYLQGVPGREKLGERISELWNYARSSVPAHYGSRYFFTKNDGLQNQSVYYMQEGLGAKPTLILDPNLLSSDGTVAVSFTDYNHDGTLLAYGLSKSGSDWEEIMIRDLNTGKDFPESLKRCKFASAAWPHSNKGFYYNRYPEEGSVPKADENFYNKLYWHALGTPQSEDRLVFEPPDAKELATSPSITDDGRYLLLYLWKGTDPNNRIYYRPVESDSPFVRVLDKMDAQYTVLWNDGSLFYVQTDLDAPRGRIVAIDFTRPEQKNWKELIPQGKDVIASASVIDRRIIISYLHDAHHELKIYSLDGTFIRPVDLPALGSVGGISGRPEDKEMFFAFTSFVYPTTLYRYDLEKNELSTYWEPTIAFDRSGFETHQVMYPSKDGTTIPMFLVYKKGLKQDGTNPTLVLGYGGFDISMTPSFLPWRLVWLERGGIFAVANIRGGGEYGEEWHKAGTLDRKQNVFDDFVAGCRWLVDNKYTSTSRLAIIGGSNGGLLVSACALQHPDLFGAVICEVPVTDMLRYQKFTVGKFWVSDYGNAEESAKDFGFLYAYSPLHNVKKGVAYPPMLITTADHDDRVVPAHAMKFAATLQANDAGVHPILLRVETKAGHGGGKPISKQIEELRDILTFLTKTLGLNPM